MNEYHPKTAMDTLLDALILAISQGVQIPSSMTVYRDLALAQEHLLNNVAEPVKNNTKAAQARQEGNRLYLTKKYEKALEKYNESICYAEAGSEQLAMGYANRSAIYYEQGEYEFALLNIRLARDHNYPEKLMEKLDTREKNCRKKIDEGLAKDNVPCPRLGINVEVNPKVPFLAKGIGMKQYPGSGRGLVAERSFKAGDVILNENTILSVVSVRYRYLNCSHCGISNQHSLIPCPNCVHCMYCSEECLVGDKHLHRFECGFGAQLGNVTFNCSNMGHKLFFYGLQLFKDDLNQMMNYCERNAYTGADPFTMDYRKYDPLEEFKLFIKSKITCNPLVEITFKLCAAASYVVLMKRPSIQTLFASKSQKQFFLNCLYNCHRVSAYFAWENNTPAGPISSGLTYIAKVINHSCDPNAMAFYDSERVKCILIRPVRKGEQITYSLGPAWFNPGGQQVSDLSFKCRCNVCRYGSPLDWLSLGKPLPANARNDLSLCMAVVVSETANDAAKLNALQQIVQRYDHFLPNMDLSFHLRIYTEKLKDAVTNEHVKLNRAKVAAMVG
uniref:SET domain-containing protein n=1 Tax=Culex tarsalis TaxID=7177 RepID=A0A1Q3F091_CULTA